jgi:hypothetical protein
MTLLDHFDQQKPNVQHPIIPRPTLVVRLVIDQPTAARGATSGAETAAFAGRARYSFGRFAPSGGVSSARDLLQE